MDGANNSGGLGEQDPPPFNPPAESAHAWDDSDTSQLRTLAEATELGDLKVTWEFVNAIRNTSLEDESTKLTPEMIARLRNPPVETLVMPDSDTLLSLELYLSLYNSSEDSYNTAHSAILHRHPNDPVLSYQQVEKLVSNMSGVQPIEHDMCVNSCLAYTGPSFSALDECLKCGELRYNLQQLSMSGKQVPRQTFHTIPIGPQLQALWRSPTRAEALQYRRNFTNTTLCELFESNEELSSYRDIFSGSDYLSAVQTGHIKPHDPILMISMDGAQLYCSKSSDCWIYIWVILDHAPEVRYKKQYVLPGGFIPGPNNPKVIDSFLFPGLHHLSALQRQGLQIWDASSGHTELTRPFLALSTADGPAMAYFSGFVGHSGRQGCRLFCGFKGWRKPGASHYYPVSLKPLDYFVQDCDHSDVNPTIIPSPPSHAGYINDLRSLTSSKTEAKYKRLKTGLSKPTIFLGLQANNHLGIPNIFGSDIMHLVSLNIPDLLINLWPGTMDCDNRHDSKSTWPWAVLQGNVWELHGKAVQDATPYLPGSFDHTPQNPAEKISSGYKAWEFLLYIFGLGPGLFYNVLPKPHWWHFCKLVAGIQIVNQYSISQEDLSHAHILLCSYVQEFEELYYQQKVSRLLFIRPCLHQLTHLTFEVTRVGPAICSSQWTMERTIGNLGEEIRQPSNPYANLSHRGILRAQVNALKAMVPILDATPP